MMNKPTFAVMRAWLNAPGLFEDRAVLATVNTEPPAAVALRASVDRRCARRLTEIAGRGEGTAPQPNKGTDLNGASRQFGIRGI